MTISETEIFECKQQSTCDSCRNDTIPCQLMMGISVSVTDLNLEHRFHICLDCAEKSEEQKIKEALIKLKNICA